MILERKLIQENIGDIDIWDMEGDLEALIKRLEDFKKKEQKYEKYSIIADVSHDGEDGYASLIILGHRTETDEELSKRQDTYNRRELKEYMKQKQRIETNKKLDDILKGETLEEWKYS